ncbi:MAG: type II toxin-antitoxin system HicB family antitoxin [Thermoleophilia bacterium]|nr:type II toxin-antitoxin system HicB family antitoxin [Thermoleophilia bacterium]
MTSFTVIIRPDAEGGFVASVPSLPGCYTQGETLDETRANVQEAIRGYLKVLRDNGDPIPDDSQVITETVLAS